MTEPQFIPPPLTREEAEKLAKLIRAPGIGFPIDDARVMVSALDKLEAALK